MVSSAEANRTDCVAVDKQSSRTNRRNRLLISTESTGGSLGNHFLTCQPLSATLRKEFIATHSSVAQWQSIRLLTEGL